MEREIRLPRIGNARELGGCRIGDTIIKSGILFRTASLDQASPAALDRLHNEFHLQTIIDFRMSGEKELHPDPVIPDCKYMHLPVLEMEDIPSADPEMVKLYTDPNTDRMQLFDLIYESGALDPQMYNDFLLRDRGKQAYRQFFQSLLSLEEGRSVLWHCTDGKDRTGCAAMLLLFALGASRETVMQDYLLTNEYNKEKLLPVRKMLSSSTMPQKKKNALLFSIGGVSEEYMDHAIDTLEKEYGSIVAYIEQELDVKESDCMKLRDKLLK